MRAVGDEEAHMLGGMAGCVDHVHDDIAEREPVAVLDRVPRKGHVRTTM